MAALLGVILLVAARPLPLCMALTTELSLGKFVLKNWNTDQGLPNRRVEDIAQTREGFIWVATRDGLARFDGLTFKVYKQENTPALHTSFATSLLLRSNGELLIGTSNGLNARLGGNGEIVARAPDWHYGINDMLELADGSIMLATQRGLWRLGENDERPVLVQGPSDQSVFYSIARMASGELVAGSERGLHFVRELQLYQGEIPASLVGLGVHHLAAVNDGVYAGTQNGLFWFDGLKADLVEEKAVNAKHPFIDLEVNCLLVDQHQTLWQGRGPETLVRKHRDHAEKMILYPQFSVSAITRVFEDRDGQIWVGTFEGGLFLMREGLFRMLTVEDGLVSNWVRTVFEDSRNQLWIGTDSGIVKMVEGNVSTFTRTNGLLHESVISLGEDRTGRLWIGTQNGPLHFLEEDVVQSVDPSLTNLLWDVRAILPDFDGIWLGTRSNGLHRLRPDGSLDVDWLLNRPAHAEIGIRHLYRSDEGLFLSTDGRGTIRYHDDNWEYLIMTNQMVYGRGVIESPAGTMWLATKDHGLYRWKNGVVRSIHADDGLGTEELFGILEDDYSNFWITSRAGLYQVDRRHLQEYFDGTRSSIKHLFYASGEGFSNPIFVGGSMPVSILDHKNRMVFASENGVVVGEPQRIHQRSIAQTNLYISQVLVDGEPWDWMESTEVPAGKGKVLQFEFGCIEWRFPREVHLEYKMKGQLDEWVEARMDRTAEFINPDRGTYVFQLRVRQHASDEYLELSTPAVLHLAPYFYQRLEVQLFVLLLVLFGLAILGYLRWKHLTQLAELKRRHAIDSERSRIARDMHDDVGGTLTQIALLGEMARRQRRNGGADTEHLDRITALSRDVYRTMDEIVWAVSPRNDSLEEFAAYVCRYAGEFFQPQNLRCRFDIPIALPAVPLGAEQRHNLFMVIKEAFNNTARHACATRIRLQMRYQDGTLAVLIEDDGKGFEPGRAGAEGDGLQNMRSRLDSIGGELTISSSCGQGTRISIILKLGVGKGG